MPERAYEGHVAKDEVSLYVGGVTRSWLKVKVPGGLIPRTAGSAHVWDSPVRAPGGCPSTPWRARLGTPGLQLSGFEENPIAIIRRLLSRCEDNVPPPATAALTFIADGALRDSIRSDVAAAHGSYAETEWKGTSELGHDSS